MRLRQSLLITLAMLLLSSIEAQTWSLADVVLIQNNSVLTSGLAGGLNAPQFYHVDINRDGINDLFVFDRDGNKNLVFEARPAGNCYEYVLNARLANYFPLMTEFVVVRDYNGDDIPDLFTYSKIGIAGIQLYKGIDVLDHLEFELVVLDQNYANVLAHEFGGNLSNINISRIDLPAIEDIDGDGDLDILTFPSSGGRMNLFQNLQTDRALADDAIVFELADDCWGGFYESDFSEEIFLGPTIDECATPFDGGADTRHNGSTTLIFDQNKDGLPDVLIGDFTSDRLVFMQNGGTIENAWMVDQDFNFPSYDQSLELPTFLSSFYIDLNCDDRQDLLVAPNITNGSYKTENVYYYENTGVVQDSFSFRSNSFLSEAMLDFGKKSAPTVVDLNADGWLDLVVGVAIDFDNPNAEPTGLVSLVHTGDADNPEYTVDDTDWLGFSAFADGSRAFAPTFADMDDDGDMDLIVGDEEGFLFYGNNIAGPGQPVNIPFVQYGWMNIDAGQFATPTVADINGDDLPDLIIGEKNPNNDIISNMICGNINYYQNIGTPTSPNFISNSETPPNTNCLGNINTKYVNNISGFAAPDFYDTGDSLLLFVGVNSGNVARYRVGAVGEVFPAIDTFAGQIFEGRLSMPVVADLDKDELLEIVVGNQRGGISIYDTPIQTDGAILSNVRSPEVDEISVLPNPLHRGQSLTLKGIPGSYQLAVYTSAGKCIHQQHVQKGDKHINLPNVTSGVHILHFRSANHTFTRKLLII